MKTLTAKLNAAECRVIAKHNREAARMTADDARHMCSAAAEATFHVAADSMDRAVAFYGMAIELGDDENAREYARAMQTLAMDESRDYRARARAFAKRA